MIFHETRLSGAFVIDLEKYEDERGFFARSWCCEEFEHQGLNNRLVQCNISFNNKKGTVRGMHYQTPPFAEAKLVRCTRGSLVDVIVDLRPSSPTFLQQTAVRMNESNRLALYVPEGFAHGFQTLADDTEVFYQMSQFYSPEHAFGICWNDPILNITWPEPISIIAEKDLSYPICELTQFEVFNQL